MMKKSVRVDAEAEEEIAAWLDWYESKRPGLGSEFLDEVRAAMRSLERARSRVRPSEWRATGAEHQAEAREALPISDHLHRVRACCPRDRCGARSAATGLLATATLSWASRVDAHPSSAN